MKSSRYNHISDNSNILFSKTLSRTTKQVSNFILNSMNKVKIFNNENYEMKEVKEKELNNIILIQRNFPNTKFILSDEILLSTDFNVQILFKFNSINNINLPYKIGILIDIYDITCEEKCFIIFEKYYEFYHIKKYNEIEDYINHLNCKEFLEYINYGLNNNNDEFLVYCSVMIQKSFKIICDYAININLIFSKFDNVESRTFEMEGNLGKENSIFYVYNKPKNVFTQYILEKINQNKKITFITVEYSKKCNGIPALNEGIIYKIASISKNLTWICVKNKIYSPISKETIKMIKQYTYYYIKKIKDEK